MSQLDLFDEFQDAALAEGHSVAHVWRDLMEMYVELHLDPVSAAAIRQFGLPRCAAAWSLCPDPL